MKLGTASSHDSFLDGVLRPHLSLAPYAVETDKPPRTHRCSGRSGLPSSGIISGTLEHAALPPQLPLQAARLSVTARWLISTQLNGRPGTRTRMTYPTRPSNNLTKSGDFAGAPFFP